MKKDTKLKPNAIIYIRYGIATFLQTRKTMNNAAGEAYFNIAIIVIGYLKADKAPNTTHIQRTIAINLFLLCRSNNSLSKNNASYLNAKIYSSVFLI